MSTAVPVPARRGQRQGPRGGRPPSPRPSPPQGRARAPRLPSAPGPPPPGPGPALRDVLVEVGEEQLVGAGLAALTGQVHGGRAAGGWPRPEARAERGRVHSGSAPGPARRRSRRRSPPRDQSPPHPSPLLFMLGSRGALRACAARPLGARASHGAGVLRGPAPSPLARVKVPVKHAQAWGRTGRAGRGFRALRLERRACAWGRVSAGYAPIILFILKGPPRVSRRV